MLKKWRSDSKDPSVDTFKSATLAMLKRFGVPPEGLELKIESRGVPPHGGGEIILSIPIVQDSLKAISWIDEGMVKRIRGISFSTRVSVQFENTMIHVARGILNHLLPDVYIFTDHKAGPQAGNFLCIGKGRWKWTTRRNKELSPSEDVGEQITSMLLGEIEQGGVVDSTHQGLLFLLCALCPQDVSKVRVGQLVPHGIEVLRHIRDFLGVKFVIKPDPSTMTVILKCVGCGLKNLSRKIS
ncbi:putative RNA 3'-terminal phosphate cyclase-like protein [Abeliophyllum distichum]|uniref:RNA 3'-terminal phosphate cyclase-like protein n=1 Tax=Abeliophyllum distichum TaxID=126358 RepID=A0ABD1RG36_9LAMI